MASYADSLFDVTSFYADAATVSFQIAAQVNRTSNSDTLAIKNISTDAVILSFNLGSWSAVGNNQKTITLTSAQRTTLLNAMGNVARFQVQYEFTSYYNGSVIGSNFIYGYIYRSSADSPTINSVSWADTNAASVAVTDNAQIMISGKSNLVFTITATAKANRSISTYTVQQAGGYYLTRDNGTVDMGLFRPSGSSVPGADPNTSSTRFTVTVVDNLGNATFQDVFVSYYNYTTIPVLTTYNIKRNASDNTKLDISFTGKYSNIATNTVTAKYKYKVAESGSYSAETSLTLTISGDTFSCSTTTGSILAEDSTYEFVLILADKLQTNNVRLTIPSVVPLVTFRPEAVGIGGEPTHTKALDVADGYSLNANGTHNTSKVMPYSFRTNGGSASAGWARIARIILVSPSSGGINIKPVIEFTVQRYATGTSHLKVMFNGTSIISETVEPTANNFAGYPTTANSAIVWDERVSTDPYTYDIYFPKANADDVLTVYTYCDASFQDIIKIEYADALATTAPSSTLATIRYFALAPLQSVPIMARLGLGWQGATTNDAPASHTLTLASDWSIVDHGNISVDGKYNTMAYMPYSAEVTPENGVAGYAKLATLTITGAWINGPITFKVWRRNDFAPIELYLFFAGASGTDPAVESFMYSQPTVGKGRSGIAPLPVSAYVYKTATSVWDVYIQKSENNEGITVAVEMQKGLQNGISVTYPTETQTNIPTSIPSGAVVATQLGALQYTYDVFNNTQSLVFGIDGNTARKLAGANGGECAWLLSCTGWNTNIRSGLWYISGYNDSSRADITALKSPSAILINPVANELAWTITNNSITRALFTCTVLYGAMPTIT